MGHRPFRYVISRRNDAIYTHIDHLIRVGDIDVIDDAFDYLVKLLQDLSFPISKSKLISPTTVCHCLGIIINTVDYTLSIPNEKFNDIVEKCEAVYFNKFITLKQFQSVIGSLKFAYKCVKPTQFIINRLLDALRNATSTHMLVLTEMHRDLAWLLKFLLYLMVLPNM